MKKPRIYLSGPVSYHDKEEVIERFKKYADYFIEKGYRVFNPLENGLPYESDSHLHMRRDINILTNETDPFDCIFMMKKWTHSGGCWKEFEAAVSSGIRIIFEEISFHDASLRVVGEYASVTFK
jgi:hypothetical protein